MAADLADRFGLTDAEAVRIVQREGRIKSNLAALPDVMSKRVVNLPELLGHEGPCGAVRVGITLRFRDKDKGVEKSFGFHAELRQRGQFRSIINEALTAAIIYALEKDYSVPFIALNNADEGAGYTIDEIECR